MLRQIHAALRDAIAPVSRQLGFSLLTGSSENFIRDMLAAELHDRGLIVGRDYRRKDRTGKLHILDIAVFEKGHLSTCVELKQLNLKDMRSSGPLFFKNLSRDMAQRQRVCESIYGVLLLRDISAAPATDEEGRFSYVHEDLKRRAGSIDKLVSYFRALRDIEAFYPQTPSKACVSHSQCCEVTISLYAWVLRPLTPGSTRARVRAARAS
jgi:hypothetical protein